MQEKKHTKFLKTHLTKLGVSLTALAALTVMTARPAMAEYPNKPIVIVVPFSPGGSTDQIGRMIAQHFTNDFNVAVVVENKPGASGTVGNSYVARANPDGYTLLIGGTDITASQFLYKDLPYDPEQAFTPIGIVSEFPFLMLVDKKSNITTVQAFVDYAKKNPDKITFSSAGMGNSTHLAGETFKHAAKLDGMVHVPYNGSPQALTAVISGQVDTIFDTAITAAPLVTGGKANALGVVAQRRLPLLPNVPTMSELGYKEFDQLAPWSWKGLFAPSGTPQEVLDKLQESLSTLLESPEFQERIEASASLVVAPQSTASAKQFLTDQRKGWSKLISDANIRPM